MGRAGELRLGLGAIAGAGLLLAQLLGPLAWPAAGAQTENVFAYGDSAFFGSMGTTQLANPIVGVAATPDGGGYWLVGSDGSVSAFGDATFLGSTASLQLNHPIVGVAATPDGGGYWLVGSDGGIFAFGDAQFFGSTGNIRLNQPIVAIAATPDGHGYWMEASDGGIFAFGDATFHGSTGNIHLVAAMVGMAATPDGNGYWLVGADGGVFAFGDAIYRGSTGAQFVNTPIVAMARSHDGGGYWLVEANGGIFSFGDAAFFGSPSGSGLTQRVTSMAANPVDGAGYWIVTTGNYAAPPPPPPPPPPAGITGSVHNAAGTGLGSVCVDATDTAATPGSGTSVTGTYHAYTSVTGGYDIAGLPASQYTVAFHDCAGTGYLPQWFDHQPSAVLADPVSVSAGSTASGIDADLVLGGSIGGTVTDTSAHPVSGICVDAFDTAGQSSYGASTSVTGSYRVIGMPTGQYDVEFRDCTSRGYVTQWYNGKPDQASADPVAVNQGALTPHIDASLAGGPPPDTTPPTVTSSLSPPPNAAGWNNRPVTLSWTVTDDTSVTSTTGCGTTLVDVDTAGTTYSCTATDSGGLTTTSSQTVRLDTTPPTVTGTPDRPPNQYGWYQGPVTLRFTCSDALSGVAVCPSGVTLSSDGGNQSATGTAQDVAGNVSSTTVTGISIDSTPPTVTAAPTTEPNANGWYAGPVTVAFTCSDALSGIASCPQPVTLYSEGANQSVSGTAVDKAGNSAVATVYGVNIDTGPPSSTIDPTSVGIETPALSTQVTGTAADSLSGVDSVIVRFVPDNPLQTPETDLATLSCDVSGRSCTWSVHPPSQPGTYTVQVHAVDKAGNFEIPGPSASLTVL